MKNIQSFRKSIIAAEGAIFDVVAHIRAAQQKACGEGVVCKLAEQRSFELLQKSLALRDEIARFKSAIEE